MTREKDVPSQNSHTWLGLQIPKKLIDTGFPILLLFLNLALKSLYLTSQEIGLDEPFSIYHAQFDFLTIIDQLKGYNNPPLYELLLHYWTEQFGISPVSIRVLPLLFACLGPVTLYYFSRRHFSLKVAITSSGLLSFSSLLVYYAHDCRVYSLFLLLSVMAMHFFMRYLQQPKIGTLIGLIVFNVLIIYAHYFGFFILLFQVIYLLLFYRTRILKLSVVYIIVVCLYLPHLLVMAGRLQHSVKNGTWLQPPAGIESLYNMLWSFSNAPVVTVVCIVIMVAAQCIALSKRKQGAANPSFIIVLIWFFIPFLGMFFISFWVPMYISRYLIFALPAYYLLLSLCLQKLARSGKWQLVLITLLLFGFAITIDLDPDKKQRNAEAIYLLKALKDPSTVVVVSPKDYLPTFAYHYNRGYFAAVSDNKEYHLTDSLLKSENIFLINSLDELPPGLSAIASANFQTSHKKIIYLSASSNQDLSARKLQSALSEKHTLLYTKQFNNNLKLQYFK